MKENNRWLHKTLEKSLTSVNLRERRVGVEFLLQKRFYHIHGMTGSHPVPATNERPDPLINGR